MWVPWLKTSSTRTHTRAPSLDDHPPSSPIHHHSPSLKDLEALLDHQPPLPSTPLHKHSLSSLARSPTHHSAASFKDLNSLLFDNPTQTHSPIRKPSVFNRVRTWAHRQTHQPLPPDSNNRVVVYFTSLRVVRRTYEDCRAVRSILKGYRVKMDERDLAMDGGYVEELQRITSLSSGKKLSVPRVYVDGKCVGGVEEIRRLHESGDLKRLIQGLPLAEGGVCRVCGGYRYVVCEWCDGSHRDKSGFKSCTMCNVNGLILCGFCTTAVF